jgi:hypothetical protein
VYAPRLSHLAHGRPSGMRCMEPLEVLAGAAYCPPAVAPPGTSLRPAPASHEREKPGAGRSLISGSPCARGPTTTRYRRGARGAAAHLAWSSKDSCDDLARPLPAMPPLSWIRRPSGRQHSSADGSPDMRGLCERNPRVDTGWALPTRFRVPGRSGDPLRALDVGTGRSRRARLPSELGGACLVPGVGSHRDQGWRSPWISSHARAVAP